MPPKTEGTVQVSAITVELVIAALLASKLGGSGFVVITDPLPGKEAAELPTEFWASTFAETLAPHARV